MSYHFLQEVPIEPGIAKLNHYLLPSFLSNPGFDRQILTKLFLSNKCMRRKIAKL